MARSSKDIQLSELKDMISQLNMTIKTLNDTIARQQSENDNLKAELAWFRQKLFGSSSERRMDDVAGQLSLFENLGSEMLAIGTEVIRSEIVYTPPKLERIEYIATTYACPECRDTEEPQFIKDNGTPALISGSYVSESLLAYILYRKYGLYIPLYRQEQDFQQQSAPIGRASMVHWIITAGLEYMQPVYDYFHRELLKRRFLMMHETPIQVLKEEGRRAQSKSYFWLIRTGEDGQNPIVLYNYTPTRAGENARQFLKGIEPGFYLMADGYQGYNKVKETKRCCCWANIRRYLLEAIPKGQEKDYSGGRSSLLF